MAGFRALFLAYDSTNTQRLWVTDGTDAGTVPFSDPQFSTDLLPQLLYSVPFGNELLFSSADSSELGHLFISDGTVAGTGAIPAPDAAQYGLQPANLFRFGDTVYFSGNSAAFPNAVWSIHTGDTQATVLINQDLAATSFAEAGGAIYCNGLLPHSTTFGVYRLDGTTPTALPIGALSQPDDLTGLGRYLLFSAGTGGLPGLYGYDTLSGTTNLLPASTGGGPFSPSHITVLGGVAYFEAEAGAGGTSSPALWRTDGTAAGTAQISLPNVKALSTTLQRDQPFALLGDRLLLSAIDTSNKMQLFVTDGTAAGTAELSTSGVSANGLQPMNISAAGDTAIFTGTDSLNHSDLFTIDSASLTITKLAPAGTGNAFGVFGFFPSEESAFSVACFRAGTRIATPDGPIPVERLAAGARVIVQSGRSRTVRWVGHRRIDCRRHPSPQAVWPVRICADAFAPGAPSRDLWLSPDHAVFADGVLIPARYLVNGATVRQEACATVTYYHIELASHDVLLAEDLPCESFLDTGNRADFDNGGAVVRLHPDFARQVWRTRSVAPLHVAGAPVVAVRRHLIERAQQLGQPVSAEPDLRLRAGGRTSRPVLDNRWHHFQVPRHAASIRLRSRSAVPAQRHADSLDHRRLGVAIARIVYDGQHIPLDDPRLGGGWHRLEHGADGAAWRWTDGDAALSLPGGHRLSIEVLMTEQYWAERPARPARAAGR